MSRVASITARAPGEPLWGREVPRQPLWPMIALALIVLTICTPAALSSNGVPSNPVTLLKDIADSTYEITGLLDESNKTLKAIDDNIVPLGELQGSMAGIAESTKGMEQKTKTLDSSLGAVGASVGSSKTKLESVNSKLGATAAGMGQLGVAVDGSLASTEAIVADFSAVDGSIGAMDKNLKNVIVLMGVSEPATRKFATNKTRIKIAGGEGKKFGVYNIVPGTRVMSVMLPMISTMQEGGALPARKDSAEASNPLVGTLLKVQVPDGTNVPAIILPYDGLYGLPGKEYFVVTPVNGF